MPAEESRLKEKHFSRIRRMKRLLRPLPRRANLHRYPFIKWFAKTARKRAYLWSFRSDHCIAAFYAGCILAFMPLYGAQIPLAFLAALVLKTNLPILIGLQFISNPLTVPFIYATAFFIGDFLLSVFGDPGRISQVTEPVIKDPNLLKEGAYAVIATMTGGLIIGYFAGFVTSLIYQVAAKRAARTYARIKEIQKSNPVSAPKGKSPSSPKSDFKLGKRSVKG